MSSTSARAIANQSTVVEASGPHLGHKLRLRRTVKGLSLQQVALRSGISVGQVSQIERGVSSPSLRSLHRICGALDMPVSWLFEGAAANGAGDGLVVKAAERRSIDLPAHGIVKELLTPDSCPEIQMIRILLSPGGGWEAPFSGTGRPTVARCCTVLAGRLTITLDGVAHHLAPGDSFAANQGSHLAVCCDGPSDCELIWVVTPAVY